jgi:hypothetical protein
MINTYEDAVSCIDDAIHYEMKAGNAMNNFSNSTPVNSPERRRDMDPKKILRYALMQHKDIDPCIRRLRMWADTDAPNIEQYGNAKKFFMKKRLSRTLGYATIGFSALGIAGLVLGDMPLVISGIAMPAMGYVLSVRYRPKRDDKRFEKDLDRYELALDTYNLESKFHKRDMIDLIRSLDSYIYALKGLMDKLSPEHIKNGLPNDDLNDIIDTYIELNLFKKNAPRVMDIISKQKQNAKRRAITAPIISSIDVAKRKVTA